MPEVGRPDSIVTLSNKILMLYVIYHVILFLRKLLIQDLNDMKYQQDEAKRSAVGKQDEGGAEDVTMLKLALK